MFTPTYRLLPGLVGATVVALTLLLWQALLIHERRIIENQIRLAMVNIEYEVRARITHDPLPVVWANAPRLQLVLQHLLANALKFHNTLPPHVHVSAGYRENEWRFRIHDNGIGIEPPYVERVFEMFERLHPQAAYLGTGMGLTLCRKIVAQHGGRIWVEAAQDQGAVFIFTLGRKRGGRERQGLQHTEAQKVGGAHGGE